MLGKGGPFINKKNLLDHMIDYLIMNDGRVRGWMKNLVHAENFMLLEAGENGSPLPIKLNIQKI